MPEPCPCSKCTDERDRGKPWFARESMRMIVCPTCGNKRCPHAADHALKCTGSNEPGQPGSNYPSGKESPHA